MMRLAILALFVLMTAATVAAQSKGGGACPIPGIGPFECPVYTYNTTTYGVEFRSYPTHTVALCPLRGFYNLLEAQAVAICYPELDAYFNGENADGTSILRTAPVSQYWFYAADGYHYYYTIFYIPVAITTPPAPINPYVVIANTVRELEVATLQFSPNATALDQDIINFGVFQLSYALNYHGIPFSTDAHHISWYEPPFLPPRNLRNEVWAFFLAQPNATVTSPYAYLHGEIPASKIRTIEPKAGAEALKKITKKIA